MTVVGSAEWMLVSMGWAGSFVLRKASQSSTGGRLEGGVLLEVCWVSWEKGGGLDGIWSEWLLVSMASRLVWEVDMVASS